jgi:hypothetical protein
MEMNTAENPARTRIMIPRKYMVKWPFGTETGQKRPVPGRRLRMEYYT